MTENHLYQQSVEEEARSSITILVLLAFCLFPLFSILDYFTQREYFRVLSLIRFSTTFFYLFIYLMFRQGRLLEKPFLISNILLGIASLSITTMCVVSERSASPYYAGVNLVVLAGVLILPVNARAMSGTVSLIIGIYIIGILIAEKFSFHAAPHFINNLFFLVSTGVIGVTAAHIKHKLRADHFYKGLEIQRTTEVLLDNFEGGKAGIEDLAHKVVHEKGEAQTAVATRDGFISMASHELKSPLTSMKLQMDLAMLKLKSNPEETDHILRSVSAAYRQIDKVLRLIDEMLDVSRIQSGKFNLERDVSELNDLVSGILLRYYSEYITTGNLKHFPSHMALKGFWDSYKIEQVIVNLVNNAHKYGNNSEVKVETGVEGNYAFVTVSDKGPGIPAEDLSKIFEKFERGRTLKSGGLGLGLYISKQIIEAHEGKIVLESESGKGTCFKVLLPLNAKS